MYTSDRPSPVHAGRMCIVSPKVTRENGPDGSCLTQISDATPRTSMTASDRPSGESATVLMFPSSFQVVSIGAATPSRPTHQAVVAAALPPDEYASVPLALTAKFNSNGPERSMPSITATLGPVTSRFLGSNGIASSLPSPVTTSRWPDVRSGRRRRGRGRAGCPAAPPAP